MFTGIVEGTGHVVRVLRRGGGAHLEIRTPVAADLRIGDSIAVNGTCVTVTVRDAEAFACDLVPETLARTTLATLQPGDDVNLERPMRADGRFDGHIVQGHVDTVGTVRSRRRVGAQEMLEINVPFELTRYLAPKGSVALDGVSLTIVDVNKDRFRVALIPHTCATTTLGKKIQGQTVNVEVDVISKYVERHVAARTPRPAPSLADLVRSSPLVVHSESEMVMAPPAQPAAPGSPKVSSKPAPQPKAPAKPSKPAPRPKKPAKAETRRTSGKSGRSSPRR